MRDKPKRMSLKLMPHQEEGVSFLESRNGCGLLAFECGVGKTLTALEYVKRANALPLVIIAPVSLLGMWQAEIKRWYGWETIVIKGTPAKRKKLYAGSAQVFIIGYETFRTDKVTMDTLPVKACICDESGKIRTPTAKISKAVRAYLPPVRIALDGTPISNSLADLWNPCEWVKPGIFLGNWWAFRRQFAIMNPYIPGKIDGWRDEDRIIRTANQHIMWKKKVDVLHDLPPITHVDIPLELSPEEMKEYKRIKEELKIEILGEELPITNALTLLMRLRQAANGCFSPSTPTKTKAVAELAAGMDKVVIFSQFETVVRKLVEDLPFECVSITGSVSVADRESALERFKTDSNVKALVMTSAGERGLNIQCASHLIQHDLTWSNASEEQRIGRIWRHGQTSAVTVHNLLAEGTVDIHMKRILSRKKNLAESVVTYEDIQAILD
uniref:Putative helicase n=1 Tax=viral metagenome TaxID=1070528 RepID=A0A6M3JWR9_9ZZZZ